MKTRYIITYDGLPITHIAIDNETFRIVTDEDCKPIFFDHKDAAVKMAMALVWYDSEGTWDYGWEKVYV